MNNLRSIVLSVTGTNVLNKSLVGVWSFRCVQVSKAKHIPMGSSVSLLILDYLISKIIWFLIKVPVLNCTSSTTAPTTKFLDCISKSEEVCADTSNLAKSLKSSPSCIKVTELGSKRQNEDGWIILRSTTRI